MDLGNDKDLPYNNAKTTSSTASSARQATKKQTPRPYPRLKKTPEILLAYRAVKGLDRPR